MQHGYISSHVKALAAQLLLVAAKHDPRSESIQTILCVAKSLGNVAEALTLHSLPDRFESPALPDLPPYPESGKGGDGGIKIPLSPSPSPKGPPTHASKG